MPLDCEESVGHSCGCPFGLSSETGLLVTTSFSGSDRMDNVLKDHRCPTFRAFRNVGFHDPLHLEDVIVYRPITQWTQHPMDFDFRDFSGGSNRTASRIAHLTACFLMILCPAIAQKQPPRAKSPSNPSQLTALKVTGTTRYTDKEILAASGLQIGQNASDGDFKEAVQRLGNSGLFGDVVYTYSTAPTGTRLELQLA